MSQNESLSSNKDQARNALNAASHKAITRHSGKMKTIRTKINYGSDHIHSFLSRNEQKLLNAFERLAAILRMAKTSPSAYKRIADWHKEVNLSVAQVQLDALQEQRLEKEKLVQLEGSFEIQTPDYYEIELEVSHPVGHTIAQLIKEVDTELNEIEKLFMHGALDDLEYEQASKQATVILTGVTDRIMKVTSPGKREGGQFNPRYFMEFLRDPHFSLLSLCDIPLEIAKQILNEEQLKQIIKHKEKNEAPKNKSSNTIEVTTSESKPSKANSSTKVAS